MIDISAETVVTFTDAAKDLPRRRRGRPVHPATLHRWASRGIGGVRLEFIKIGGTRCTSREALQRFFDTITRASGDEQAAASRPVERDVEQTSERLEQAGW